jgi:hypothetical protein
LFLALEGDLADGNRLPAFLGLVFGLAFFALLRVLMAFVALVLELAFLGLAFLALVRVLAALPAERSRAGFSGFVSCVAAGIGCWSATKTKAYGELGSSLGIVGAVVE